jgi:hypothetical protein
MRTAYVIVIGTLLFLLGSAGPVPAREDQAALGRALARKLLARKLLRPQTHTTDFGTDRIGCITLTSWELRQFGFRGHAFLCEEGATSTVLGAVLNRRGVVRCYITGAYAGETCYDLEICGIPETACVE